jgi:hypothetical protein
MNGEALLDFIEWVCLSFEIVQSSFPGWTFVAAHAVNANGLRGALLVGTRDDIAPRRTPWLRDRAATENRASAAFSRRHSNRSVAAGSGMPGTAGGGRGEGGGTSGWMVKGGALDSSEPAGVSS